MSADWHFSWISLRRQCITPITTINNQREQKYLMGHFLPHIFWMRFAVTKKKWAVFRIRKTKFCKLISTGYNCHFYSQWPVAIWFAMSSTYIVFLLIWQINYSQACDTHPQFNFWKSILPTLYLLYVQHKNQFSSKITLHMKKKLYINY